MEEGKVTHDPHKSYIIYELPKNKALFDFSLMLFEVNFYQGMQLYFRNFSIACASFTASF